MTNFDLYSPIAIQAANTYGVPPALFLWQIGQESSWNPAATSDNIHVGLGQFDPATAAQYGVNRLDPTSSLMGAAAYDAALYKQYGDWNSALTHYGTIGPYVPQSVNDTAKAIIDALGNPTSMAASSPSSGGGGCTDYWVDPIPSIGFAGVCKGFGSAAGLPGAKLNQMIGDYIAEWLPRVVILLVGLLLVGAGLFMFKSPAKVVLNKITG